MARIRICFIGDSLVLGTGDGAQLGWPGRLARREVQAGHDVTTYNLGIRADTSEMVLARWRAEAGARLPAIHPGALVFSFGINDTAVENGRATRVAFDQSLENARAMITDAKSWLPTLWIGPTPVDETQQPFQAGPAAPEHDFRNARVVQMSDAFAEIADDLGVPYLDLFTPLSGDAGWADCFKSGDGVHPTDNGYAMEAERIAGWSAWRGWFDD
ncbi:MAG: GDSL-type esterase/lipase family protein [Rhodospirillaceae bacterium]